jgi:hypothetical protein
LIEGLFGYTIAGGKAVDRADDRAVDGREVDRTVSWDSGLGRSRKQRMVKDKDKI